MSSCQCRAVLEGWEGYRVERVERDEEGLFGRPVVRIYLEATEESSKLCSGCGLVVEAVHEGSDRWVRDLPILEAQTLVSVPRRRLACPRCGPKVEELGWLERYSRVTRRLAESVAQLCGVLPIKQVAAFYGLGWKTVKAIDLAYLERTLGPIDLSGIETIIMDEFAIQKGHRYATVIVEPQSKRVLWVGRGSSREAVRPFFELLGPEGCRSLQAVGMDMSAAFELEVRHHCPQAKIIYDLFHVVAKFGREVIDRVRIDETRRLSDDRSARKVLKGSRWLLLRNRSNLTRPQDFVRLQELLKANRALLIVYVLKDDLKYLWSLRDQEEARSFWENWYRRAIHSRVEPLKRFARRLKPYLEGIVAHCQWPLHTSLLEGINNRIKVIKRMAYGFRDDHYFFLKIRAAFPGIRT